MQAQIPAIIEARRLVEPDLDDRFRGLYLADQHVDALLAADLPRRCRGRAAGLRP